MEEKERNPERQDLTDEELDEVSGGPTAVERPAVTEIVITQPVDSSSPDQFKA
jgi:hypothetical protein